MAGNKSGGRKMVATIVKKYGEDHWFRIGQKGGLARTENTKKKGFGSNRELARRAGARGGAASRRTKTRRVAHV